MRAIRNGDALAALLGAALFGAGLVAVAQAAETVDPPPPAKLLPASQELRRLEAPEATQGAAADARFIYAVANSVIAKYDKKTGRKVAEWRGKSWQVPHINSCNVIKAQLVCANSNYPGVPQTSSVEFLDPVSMKHLKSVSLGPGVGSLTWVDWKDGYWWAGFANYDNNGKEPPRDHNWTTVVKFDAEWRRVEAWLFPASVLDRFKPYSNSGGGWGEDGYLYVGGHDRPEIYVMKLPEAGGVLEHVATIPVPIEGQAFAFDHSARRVLYGISRGKAEVVEMRITPVP